MTFDELRMMQVDSLKKKLIPLLEKMDQKEIETNLDWMLREFGYGRSFFLSREGCRNTCLEISALKIKEEEKVFFKIIHDFTDEYAFATASLQTALELYKQFIDPNCEAKIKLNNSDKVIDKKCLK